MCHRIIIRKSKLFQDGAAHVYFPFKKQPKTLKPNGACRMSSKLQRPAKRYFDGSTADIDTKTTNASWEGANPSGPFEAEVIVAEKWTKPFRAPKSDKKRRQKLKIDRDALALHSRGAAPSEDGIKTNFYKQKMKRNEVYQEFSTEQAARTEILRVEEAGYIVSEDGECTSEYSQRQIVANVDITAATKHFNLDLDFGPYSMRYTRNGRHLLLGGRKGHVAAFDWITKRLHFEMNVTEEVVDVAWLHIETMLAVAQKNWVHFYDNQGTELHCVKTMNRVTRLEFLPYHFLLASANDEGYLSWLDVSIGKMVSTYNSRLGSIRMMAQNPSNGVLCVGGAKGVVSMWSPSTREPLAKLLCHRTAVSAVAVDPLGTYLTTSGFDKSVKIWDIRSLSGPTMELKTRLPVTDISISQKGLMAMAMGNVCEVYRKPTAVRQNDPYLRHRCVDNIHGMQFCAFEDVLGVTTRKGFTSLLVPGAGEPNFDAIEANPFQTKSQRREYEVHALLDKVPAEFIALDPNTIASVDVPTFKERIDAQKQLLHLKAPVVSFVSKNKMKGKGGSANAAKAKKIVKNASKREFNKSMKDVKDAIFADHKAATQDVIPLQSAGPKSVALDRFKPKQKKIKK